MPTPEANAFFRAGVFSLETAALRDVVAAAATQLTGEAAEVMTTFATTLQKEYRNRRGRMTRMHQDIGLEAQQRVISAYSSRVNPRGTPPYRATATGKYKRYAGGKMLQALSDPQFFSASYNGISFINNAVLDRKAKQWYRLNFGAGAEGRSGQYKPKEYRIRFFDTAVGTISLKGYEPSKPYAIPSGFFVSPQSGKTVRAGGSRGDIFVPLRSSSAKTVRRKLPGPVPKRHLYKGGMSRGFGGFHFFDPGVAYIARAWPAASTALLNEWVSEAVASATGPVAKIAVKGKALNRQFRYLEGQVAKLAAQSPLRSVL